MASIYESLQPLVGILPAQRSHHLVADEHYTSCCPTRGCRGAAGGHDVNFGRAGLDCLDCCEELVSTFVCVGCRQRVDWTEGTPVERQLIERACATCQMRALDNAERTVRFLGGAR